MKRFLEEKHDLLAGIFAIIALFSIICEIVFNGLTRESFAGGIKDLTGIILDILVFIVAAKVLFYKPIDFKEKFRNAMNDISRKYSPLLVEDKKEGCIRYNIASNSDALFIGEAKGPERIFELAENEPKEISFYINKSFFDKSGGNDYEPKLIAEDIEKRLKTYRKEFTISSKPNGTNYKIDIEFDHAIVSNDDIDLLIDLIDYTILLFVARNKS